MTEFSKLDPETRCYALVGKFFSEWAFMETRINRAIAKSLGLEGVQEAIVCSNIEFGKKIYILRSSLKQSVVSGRDKIDNYDKMLRNISKLSEVRNRFAHHAFGPSEDKKGVVFYVTSARSELKLNTEAWGVGDFENKFSELNEYYDGLEDMIKNINSSKLVSALMNSKASGWDFGAPSSLFGLSLGSLLLDENNELSNDDDGHQ